MNMPSFEYATRHIPMNEDGNFYTRFEGERYDTIGLATILDRIGSNGWELVSLNPYQWEEDFLPENGLRTTRVTGYLATFKRIP